MITPYLAGMTPALDPHSEAGAIPEPHTDHDIRRGPYLKTARRP